MQTYVIRLALLSTFLGVIGCASVSIKNENWTAHNPSPSPSKVSYLVKVEVLTDFKESSIPKHPLVEEAIAAKLVQTLQAHRPAYWTRDSYKQISSTRTPHHLLHVVITKQKPGSRLLRSLVGWGAGGTKLETQTTIWKPSSKDNIKVGMLETTGGSGATPGAIFTDPFLFLPVAAILAGTSGLTYDGQRTARTIAQAVLQQHAQELEVSTPKRTTNRWIEKVLPHLRQNPTCNNQDQL